MKVMQQVTGEDVKKKKQALYEKMEASKKEEEEKIQPYKDAPGKQIYERKATDDTTDEQLLKRVKSSLDEKYSKKAEQANADSEAARYSLAEKIKEVERAAEAKKAEKSAEYLKAIDAVEEDALKRGIARSSIANGGIAALKKGEQDAVNGIDEKKTAEKAALLDEINGLKDKLDALLKQYEEDKVAESDEKFDEAKTLRDKNNQDAVDYNNKLLEKEYDYYRKTGNDEYAKTVESIKREYGAKRLDDVVDYYRSFGDKAAALEDFLSDERWVDYLGDYYKIAFNLIYNG